MKIEIKSIRKKTINFLENNWILALLIIILIRLTLSCKLPSFYLDNLRYDDRLMLNNSIYLSQGKYLGNYCEMTLIKGIGFPLIISLIKTINIPFSIGLTLLYTLACLFFVNCMKYVIKSKFILILLFIILVFNPISYSSDAFQRLYRNSIAYIELLFFLGLIVKIICSERENIIDFLLLGITMSIMFLTKEDNIWSIIVTIFTFIYKLYKNSNLKRIAIYTIPALVVIFNLNMVSFVNYKKYNIYTYDELRDSAFKKAYIKILQIKDDEKIDKVSIPKSTFYKLADKCKDFGFTKQQIDNRYMIATDKDEEITNGNIVWYYRNWVYQREFFENGNDANEYFENLANQIDELFRKGILQKEIVIPSVFINTPTKSEIKVLPKNFIKTVIYTTTYQNIKSFAKSELERIAEFDEKNNAFKVTYTDYHNAENMIEDNIIGFELIRNLYKYSTIILSLVALYIYIKNIKKKDKLNLIISILVLIYLIIICGITYTHTTAFEAIRYCYLSNVYILQSLFIILNLYRQHKINKKRRKNNEKQKNQY